MQGFSGGIGERRLSGGQCFRGESAMEITTTTIRLRVDDGEMKCHQAQPRGAGRFPAVIVIMEAFGLNDHIKDVAERVATEGYVVIAPDLYYRESPNVVRYD